MGGSTAKSFSKEFWSASTPVNSASVTSWELIIAPEIPNVQLDWDVVITSQVQITSDNCKTPHSQLLKTFFTAAMKEPQRTEVGDMTGNEK